MSGSRNYVMNAMRMKKENMILSAEEKKNLLLFNREANLKKETEIVGKFKEMVSEKLNKKE